MTILALVALAGLADYFTFALMPAEVRAFDLNPIARFFADIPLVMVAFKIVAVAAIAAMFFMAHRWAAFPDAARTASAGAYLAALSAIVLWSLGAYANVVYGGVRYVGAIGGLAGSLLSGTPH